MAEKVTFTSAEQRDDEVFQPEPRLGARMIRFGTRDEESGRDRLPQMDRSYTNSSQMSTRSSSRRRNSIDPATALPITYRSVSYAIEETKEKERALAAGAKKDAAAELGDLEWHSE